MSRTATALLLLCLPEIAHAHPVPKDNHDRTLAVHFAPAGVVVEYRLELDEYRAVRDVRPEALVGVAERAQFHVAFRKHLAPIIAGNLSATLDGKELKFACTEQRSLLLDHVRCDYRFFAPWSLSPNGRHAFAFREGNYPLDSFSHLAVRLSHSAKLTPADVVAADDDLIRRAPEHRGPGDDERLRTLSATVIDAPSHADGLVRPAMPADLDAARAAPEGLSRYAASGKRTPRGIAGVVKETPPPDDAVEETAAKPGESALLDLLLDTKSGLAVLLLLAALFGAAHALTPGHGKTLVAAYLVGQHGTVWHALVLGLVVTLTHTGSVILLALALAWTDVGAKAAMVLLNLVGGLLIAGLGVWLLMQRLTGRADHVHVGGSHDTPDLTKPGVSWWGTVTLGMAGGIVPCWDAIILLLFALSVKRLWLGVVLLLAFSAGLAVVLVALGLLVVAARSGLGAWAEGGRLGRVMRLLPIASAVAIIAIGLVMTFGSIRGAG